MPSYSWSAPGGNCPQDAAKHANYLKADFNLVSKVADNNLSRIEELPSNLKPSILTGIEKGVAEARKNGYCPKWSKVDESIFRDVMLKNITTEAALQARDRISLDQFNLLRKSYIDLHTKLVAQLPPTATSHQSVAADAPIQATSVGGLVQSSHGTNKSVKLVQASGKPMASPQEKKGKDATEKKSDDDSSEEETSEEEESEDGESKEKESKEKESKEKESKEKESKEKESKEKESKGKESKGQDAENGQAVTDSEDSESDSASSDDDSSASSSDSEEENETQHHTDSAKVETQEIFKDGTGFSTVFNIHIEHQASVNQICHMPGDRFWERSSSLLKNFLQKQQLSSQNMCIYSCSLVKDTGDVRVIVHAETREALRQLIDSENWLQGFESTLISPPLSRYTLIMHAVEKSSMIFNDRVDKCIIIQKLEIANRAIGDQDGERLNITDISWAPPSLHQTGSLLVEFQDANHANQGVAHGLYWRGIRHACERADKEGRLLRCSRCHAYGHLVAKCTTTYNKCGKCNEYHKTLACKSKIRMCASCGGGHRAGSNRCPEKIKAKKKLEFQNKDTSQATKPAIEVARTPSSVARRSTSAGRAQTEASMPSPVSLDAESAEDDVDSDSKQHLPEIEASKDNVESRSKQPLPEVETAEDNVDSGSKQPLPQADSAQDPTTELATLRQEIEDIKKKFAALDTILQSKASGSIKRRADEAFVNGAGAESSGVAAKRIKKEEPTSEDSMGLYRHPWLYSEDRPQ